MSETVRVMTSWHEYTMGEGDCLVKILLFTGMVKRFNFHVSYHQ